MNTTYYGLLRELFGSRVKLVRRNFNAIINVSSWILTPEWVQPEDLGKNYVPFVGIKTRENLWLVDLTRVYDKMINEIYPSPHCSVYLSTAEGILVSNYPVFGEVYPVRDNYKKLYINSINETCNKYQLDYVIQLKSIYAVEKELENIEIKMYPGNFVIKDYYLCHKIYDNANKLTLCYIFEIFKSLIEITRALNFKIKAEFSQGIDTKEEFLEYLETRPLHSIFKKLGLQYTPAKGNVEEKTQNIKNTLQKLKKMIT